MNAQNDESLRAVVVSLLGEANAFPILNVHPYDFHGLYDLSDERGADGELLLQFYSAIALLAREMHLYLQTNPRDDAVLFEESVQTVYTEERARWGNGAFPVYSGQLQEGFSLGLAEAAAAGRPSLEALATPSIVHEWSSRPGALMYHSLLSTFDRLGLRERTCGKGGYYEQYAERRITAPELHVVLVTSAITLFASPATFWAPLAVLVTTTLVRRGLGRYCGKSLRRARISPR